MAGPSLPPVEGEPDTRPDFEGRTLPPAHTPRTEGTERVSTEAVFGRRTNAPVGDSGFGKRPAGSNPAGFSNLFGWRRDEPTGDNDADNQLGVAAAEDDALPEAHPEPTSFDDSDLEIPAFLRRSANN